MRPGLSPDEDAELRRLHFLHRFGAVAGRLKIRYAELRARDRRNTIRDPDQSQTAEVIADQAS